MPQMPAIAVGAAMIAAYAARRLVSLFCDTEMIDRFASRAVASSSRSVSHFVDAHGMIIDVAEVGLGVFGYQLEIEPHETATDIHESARPLA
jgi:hypothetical protein